MFSTKQFENRIVCHQVGHGFRYENPCSEIWLVITFISRHHLFWNLKQTYCHLDAHLIVCFISLSDCGFPVQWINENDCSKKIENRIVCHQVGHGFTYENPRSEIWLVITFLSRHNLFWNLKQTCCHLDAHLIVWFTALSDCVFSLAFEMDSCSF